MAITAIAAYDLLKSGVGGNLELPLFGSKRARMNKWEFVPAEVQGHRATTTGTVRVDGAALWLSYKALMDADTWVASVLTNDEGVTIPMLDFTDLSTKIQAALDAVAVETA